MPPPSSCSGRCSFAWATPPAARGETVAALSHYDRCLALHPGSGHVLYNKGVVLQRAGRSDDAASCYRAAIVAEPGFAPAYGALGTLVCERGDAVAAEALHRQAIELAPANAELHNHLGLALEQQHRHEEAVASYDAALAITPSYAAAWLNRGVAQHGLGRLGDAAASFERALALDEADAEAWSNLGLVLHDAHRRDEALAAYDRATALQPDFAAAWANRGATCVALKRFDDAFDCYERALAIDPEHGEVLGSWLHAKMLRCDWQGLDAALRRVASAVQADAVMHPFALLPTPLPAALHKRCAVRYVRARCPSREHGAPVAAPARVGHERIRLGYFSADFHDHATMVLMADLFEQHDRERFELTAFSFGPPSSDAVRRRVAKAFDRFIDVAEMSDSGIAALARSHEIDIAFDLKGHTEGARPGIFACRAAPVQAGYIGYPGTSGAPFIDYLIADAQVLPEASFADFTEQIVHVPNCFLATARWQPVEPDEVGRAAAGLPEDAFVFCCFNNSYKITPDVFDVWMRLLAAVPGSILWLLESSPGASERLKLEAEARGVARARLIFAKRTAAATHLRRHTLADLFVDTLHYGAHTTAIDALRAGLPLLTRCGPTFSGRVASSALHALGLAELATASVAEYEALALALATDRDRLHRLRGRIVDQAATFPLFDIGRFTRHFEAACRTMVDRSAAGLAPAHFSVAE